MNNSGFHETEALIIFCYCRYFIHYRVKCIACGAVPAHVEESVINEHPAFQSVPLGDNVPDAVKARAVEDALQEVNDPVGSPQEFEEAIARQIRDQTNSANSSQFRFVPAVIIGAKIAGCAAGAYTALSALDKHAPYAHNAKEVKPHLSPQLPHRMQHLRQPASQQ